MLYQARFAQAPVTTEQLSPSLPKPQNATTSAPAAEAIPVEASSRPELAALMSQSVKAPFKAFNSENQQHLNSNEEALTDEERREVEELKKRDAEVKRHEQAHFRAGGQYASPPKYEYTTGPDGQRYAVGGSVEIDTSAVPGDPEATLQKARIIKRAALAPEEPSAQDRRVAREADNMATDAQREMVEEQKVKVPAAVESDIAATKPEAPALTQESTPLENTEMEVDTAGDLESVSLENAQKLQRYETSRLEIEMSPVLAERVGPGMQKGSFEFGGYSVLGAAFFDEMA